MKRFYQNAEAAPADGGYEILLDGRRVKTPARAELFVPTKQLAAAVAAEWNGQAEEIDPRSMPLTGLANAAIDRVAPDPDTFAAGLGAYGESDLLCYRADTPQALVQRQADIWDPLLAWARRRFDVDFELVCGIMHRPQHEMTLKQLSQAVAARTAFELAALSPLVTISGSLIIALALAEGAIDLEAAWNAATLDEAWQAEQWGEDAEASKALEARRRDFEAAHHFLQLL
ncbi:MAG TPA: ATP12 family protein [Allosphingosinicella sp.]|uniref:ATP12 family chaperone protein n=1 Tax=Allosphingosinicella sp. TaxID=2823234 RepID=UPI002EDB0BC5